MRVGKLFVAFVVLLLGVGGITVADPAPPKDKAKLTEVAGEVVDLRCYSSRGARGDEHRACAIRCIESGVPVGLIADDGTLYLLVGTEVLGKVEGKIGVPVVATGRLVERDGMNVIFVESVERTKKAEG